jgi:hypothetical protein
MTFSLSFKKFSNIILCVTSALFFIRARKNNNFSRYKFGNVGSVGPVSYFLARGHNSEILNILTVLL